VVSLDGGSGWRWKDEEGDNFAPGEDQALPEESFRVGGIRVVCVGEWCANVGGGSNKFVCSLKVTLKVVAVNLV